ncbi:hypothetical protein DV735_g3604, partial [Chaetothyriales sp. CBS 134920]
MDAFVSRRKRPRLSSSSTEPEPTTLPREHVSATTVDEEESTDVKLGILLSLHPHRSPEDLLDLLLDCNGSVERVIEILSGHEPGPDIRSPKNNTPKKRPPSTIGYQSALPFSAGHTTHKAPLTKKGKTLHLYSPEDIAAHTPCSIIHNFLGPTLATALLEELLPEVASYKTATFRLFDNVVQSPHTACLVSELVRRAVNDEISQRIATHYPGGKKLRFQSPREWQPTAAFVNCYDGPRQCVGYHSDQLSYLGPRAVIGSLSLGVAREFRVRRIVPNDNDNDTDDKNNKNNDTTHADLQGQISIHLPHNSLLVMHADMQEEWKHAIAPALSTDPHPVAGNKRINITYRWYRDEFSPRFTPRCRCGVPTVLKCVQRRSETRGR